MGKVFTGCRAKLQLQGKVIGYATNVTVREATEYEPIQVLDSIEVKEHAPIAYSVSMTAGMVRIVGESLKTQGFLPGVGKTPQEHLNNIISSGELTATIVDNNTGDVVMNVEGVRISESSVNINARGVVAQEATMVAIRVRDEGDLT